MARIFVEAKGSASKRLEGFVLALHRRKRPDIIQDYSARMTRLIAAILIQGVREKEYKIDDIEATAVVRDAVTVYVYPSHVEAAAKAGYSMEPTLRRLMMTRDVAFRSGVVLNGTAGETRSRSDV